MRPINLIPQEERRSRRGVSRGGPLAYLVVGALGVLLLGVVVLVLTSNKISDREAEVTALTAERAAATARAEELAPYASFAQVAEQRTQTIAGLADSRFDWARVIQQLSLILPADVYLSNLHGSAGGASAGGEAAAGISGPALTMQGCASAQDEVAGFVATLKQIDGVTRVGLNNSTLSEQNGEAAGGVGACQIGSKAQFEIVVAFDAAPPSPDSATAIAEEPEPEASAEGESSEAEGEGEPPAEGEAAGSAEGEGQPTGPAESETAPAAGGESASAQAAATQVGATG